VLPATWTCCWLWLGRPYLPSSGVSTAVQFPPRPGPSHHILAPALLSATNFTKPYLPYLYLSTCTCTSTSTSTSTFPGLSRRTLFSSPSHTRSNHHLPNTLPTVDPLILVRVLNRFTSSDCHLLTRVRLSVSHILSVIESSSPSIRGKRQRHMGATISKWASAESTK
jgi:hypothetical protein